MTSRMVILACLLVACGDDGGVNTLPDAPLAPDSAPPDEPLACTTVDLSFGSARGLIIAGDGTLYFTQGMGVGRVQPCQTPEVGWVDVGASGLTSLMVDPPNDALYIASTSANMIYKIDLTAVTPVAVPYAAVSSPEGLTLGPDGALWSTTDDGVVRIWAANTSAPVTTSTLANPKGLAFRADGSLLVLQFSGGIFALGLANNAETSRAVFAQDDALQGIIGIALDADGNVYVTSGEGDLVMVDPSGAVVDTFGPGLGAQLDFGAGHLTREDLYVASGAGGSYREPRTVAGATVPWHAP